MEKVYLTNMEKAQIIQDARKDMLHQMQDERIEQFKGLNNLTVPNGIVFAGDSLTEFFPIHELLSTDMPIYNRGVRGFRTERLKQEIDHQVIDLNPKIVFLLIGVNDIGVVSIDETITHVTEVIAMIKEKLPQTKIYLESLYPINAASEFMLRVGTRTNKDIHDINARLEKIKDVQFLDIHSTLVDNTGNLEKSYTIDGIHLSVDGYKVVANSIQTILDEMK